MAKVAAPSCTITLPMHEHPFRDICSTSSRTHTCNLPCTLTTWQTPATLSRSIGATPASLRSQRHHTSRPAPRLICRQSEPCPLPVISIVQPTDYDSIRYDTRPRIQQRNHAGIRPRCRRPTAGCASTSRSQQHPPVQNALPLGLLPPEGRCHIHARRHAVPALGACSNKLPR
jgi:hypothetical protein